MVNVPTNSLLPNVAPILSPGVRCVLAIAFVLALLGLLAGALVIPFTFESPSLWYKFGAAKISLRAGKMIGIAAGLLVLLQLPLAGRSKLLDRIYSLPALMRQHRMHAWAIASMAIVHPLLVLLAEGSLVVPLESRYWPEWVGVGLLAAILAQFISSRWRRSLGIAFHVWLPAHRIAGLLVAGLLIVHVLYVSESFSDQGPPRWLVMAAAACFLSVWLWRRTEWWRARRHRFSVSRITTTGTDCTCVELTPQTKTPFAYVPGQFAFVSFRSTAVSAEPHAFTISSTPSRPEALQFTIRACGDWTRDAAGLSTGDEVLLHGPFGRFGHLFSGGNRELIMIAGGIGVTPMLSMLRFMADADDPRPVTLVWSNRSRETTVFDEEMAVLAARLTAFRHVPIFTRNAVNGNRSGRLNRTALEQILRGCSRKAAVYVCGPPRMMKQIVADLKALGFPARSIHTEAFGL